VTETGLEVLIHVRRGEEFLVAHRSAEGGGYWHPIAGGVEHGEAFHAAAIRELREETGLTVAQLEPLGEFSYTRKSWEEDAGQRVHVEAFLVDVEPGWEPKLNEEHVEYRWLAREEAAELLFWPEPAALLRSLP
jgi:8-oxo-dGTP pyrophosphatase MutT (NUDIX family)